MKLVIVESPAKCSKIAGFLGPDYRVLASMGHIRALDEDLDAIGIDRDFEARFVFMKDKAKAINALKAAAQEASEVILAADDDREGEAIAYSVALLLKLPVTTTKRAVFHEITKKAVCQAVDNPRILDMNRVYAQQSRAILDMMIGFTISPLLWKHVARGLSAGRCQTPALRFVCDREAEIGRFAAQTSWIVRGTWTTASAAAGAKAPTFVATLCDELEDEESATNYLEMRLEDPQATIMETATRPWTENPPPPLITSTLQQAASSIYHSNPKNTMRVAQRLYEAGHITYMRTDKAVLCAEAVAEAQALVTTKYGAEFVGSVTATASAEPKKTKGKAKAKEAEDNAQEAHEAIRPTHFDVDSLAGAEWTPLDQNIYRLIRARAIQSIMAPARGDTITIKMKCDSDDEDFLWSATGRRTIFQGWRVVGARPVDDDESSESDSEGGDAFKILSAFKVGQKVQWKTLESQPHITKAAPRYTEATLVKALEQRGIGRPSTFASLLDAIIEKKYVEKKNIEGTKATFNKYMAAAPGAAIVKTEFQRSLGAEKDRLVPTELGHQMLAFALKHFADLFDYGFTAGLETSLDKIAEGAEPWKNVLRLTWNSYKDRYGALNQAVSSGSSGQSKDSVKDLGDGLKAQITKKGPLLIQESAEEGGKAKFYGWPHGVTFADITPEVARQFITRSIAAIPKVGTHEGEPITKHKGQYGEYAKWKDISVPWKEGDTLETIIEKIIVKSGSSVGTGGAGGFTGAQTVGPFTFKTGPYGPYMYKTELKTKKFVSVPAGLDASKLTVREADEIYKQGLEEKAEKAKKGAQWAAVKAAKGR
jgi:DNA topoisomerase-1